MNHTSTNQVVIGNGKCVFPPLCTVLQCIEDKYCTDLDTECIYPRIPEEFQQKLNQDTPDCPNGSTCSSASSMRCGSPTYENAQFCFEDETLMNNSSTFDDDELDESSNVLDDSLNSSSDYVVYMLDAPEMKDGLLPSIITLIDYDIEAFGSSSSISQLCHLAELDLTDNLIHSWSQILSILKNLPSLQFLNLSNNLICDSFHTNSFFETQQDRPSFNSLIKLIMNGNKVSWESASQICSLTPNLEMIQLCSNNLYNPSSLNLFSQNQKMKQVYLTCNPITSFHSLVHHLCLPSIEELSLINCPIASVPHVSSIQQQYPTDGVKRQHQAEARTVSMKFQNLKNLRLAGTCIASWKEVDKLCEYPLLRELRLQECPLLDMYDSSLRRMMLVSRLPNIQILNGGDTISETEREDCERGFIRYYIKFMTHDASSPCNNEPESLPCKAADTEEEPASYASENQPLTADIDDNNSNNSLDSGLYSGKSSKSCSFSSDKAKNEDNCMDDVMECIPSRFHELVSVHGKLDPLAHVDMAMEWKVRIHLVFQDQLLHSNFVIHLAQTVIQFKTNVIQKLIEIPPSKIRLFYCDKTILSTFGHDIPDEMRYANKQLYTYNIQHGDKFIIDVKAHKRQTCSPGGVGGVNAPKPTSKMTSRNRTVSASISTSGSTTSHITSSSSFRRSSKPPAAKHQSLALTPTKKTSGLKINIPMEVRMGGLGQGHSSPMRCTSSRFFNRDSWVIGGGGIDQVGAGGLKMTEDRHLMHRMSPESKVVWKEHIFSPLGFTNRMIANEENVREAKKKHTFDEIREEKKPEKTPESSST